MGYSWTLKGQPHQRRVPRYFGGAGRINLIGAWSYAGRHGQYAVLEGRCTKEAVLAFLEKQAQQASQQNKLTVMVLDNASFHKAKLIQARLATWQAQNLYLRFLPPYSPQLNLIETFWRKLKAYLLPRRHYASLSHLKQALLQALDLLGAVEVKI
ncbi:IS630 family transposase [Calidithermus chliarophilus]|uniref:IS630 family transposase n=1 Tax=Calidithermus chliarophilus TaxID=52023 RepID=UPI001FDFC58E